MHLSNPHSLGYVSHGLITFMQTQFRDKIQGAFQGLSTRNVNPIFDKSYVPFERENFEETILKTTEIKDFQPISFTFQGPVKP